MRIWKKGGKMNDLINRKGAINAVCTVLYPDADKMNDAKKVLKEMPSAQPEYYDYSDIEPLWKSFAEENDINLTDTAKQLKDAMWCGYRKGKADAQSEQRWIPCSIKQPQKGLMLVTFNDGDMALLEQPTAYRRSDIVAWMPVEPYREEGEQE